MNNAITSHGVQVGIVGGGISGLTLAYRLRKARPDWKLRVWDIEDRCGGVLYTKTDQGCAIELGADSFLVTPELPWAAELARELGLGEELVDTAQKYRRAMVVHRGKLYPLPEGFQLLTPSGVWATFRSPILSWAGKLRLACEPFIPAKRDQHDESLASFATRRLGREAFERIVEPLVGGIYTADATLLSMQAALPQFVKQEQEHGSLTRAAAKRRQQEGSTGARYAMFQAPRRGLGSMTQELGQRLGPDVLRLGCAVRRVTRTPNGEWHVFGDQGLLLGSCQALALCTPAHAAGALLRDVVPDIASRLEAIPYASSAVVHLIYSQRQFKQPLDSFGFVVPRVEGLSILAGSFSSVKFPQRAIAGQEVVRVFLGGANQEYVLDHDDTTLTQIATEALVPLLHVKSKPLRSRVMRWYRRMPQFHLGHREQIDRLEASVAAQAGLYLSGNYLRGVGIPQCIHQASQVAERIQKDLAGSSTATSVE